MEHIKLIRLTEKGERFGTTGVLWIYGAPRFVTLERSWNDNHAYDAEHPELTSCIPEGLYLCRETKNRGVGEVILPKTYEVCDVPNRTGILFHHGNFERDTHGCILIGTTFSIELDKEQAIWRSRPAFNEFLRLMKMERSFTLEIAWHQNPTANTPQFLNQLEKLKRRNLIP